MTTNTAIADDQIEPSLETLGNLFLPGVDKSFKIPQYQRDYSWNLTEKQPQQFFKDIISRIKLDDTDDGLRPISQSYFVGTMIFKGNWNKNSSSMEVIDGQQRLTTTYLFLGALSNRFIDTSDLVANKIRSTSNPQDFAEKWEDLINTYNLYGDEIKNNRLQTPKKPYERGTRLRLEIETGADVMGALIFDKNKDNKSILPKCQAEKNLIDAYQYIYDNLSIQSLAAFPKFAKYLESSDDWDSQPVSSEGLYRKYSNYSTILYGIFEQLCNPSVAILSMQSEKQSNEVFESLNSKGKGLEQVDLIKNNLFERLTPNPLNRAHEYWGKIKDGLSERQKSKGPVSPWINLEQFFSLYWIAIEGTKGSRNSLYRSYIKAYKQADESNLIDFLERALDFVPDVSALYGKQSLATENIYQDYLDHAKEGLHYLVKVQVARQSFPLLASALHACRKNALKPSLFIELIDYLAVAFLFLRDIRGSKYTSILQDTAHCLASAVRDGYLNDDIKNKMTAWYIRNLEDELSDVIGDVSRKTIKEMLRDNTDFEYSNHTGDEKAHARVRYLLRIRCYRMILTQKNKGAGTEAASTWNVEHILPDSKEADSITHQLGNLLWIDKATNDECKNKSIPDKLKIYQRKASNPEIAELDDFFKSLSGSKREQRAAIERRTEDILYSLYNDVVKKQTTKDASGKEISKQRAEPHYNDDFEHFISTEGKRFQYEIRKNHWYHSFSSDYVCESLGKDGQKHLVRYPKSASFGLPFITLKGDSGIEQIDILLNYVETQLSNNYTFSRAEKGGQSGDNMGRYILKMLKCYRNYLES